MATGSPASKIARVPVFATVHGSLSVSGRVATTVTTSSGVVSAWKSTIMSASIRQALPNGARRVSHDSCVLQ